MSADASIFSLIEVGNKIVPHLPHLPFQRLQECIELTSVRTWSRGKARYLTANYCSKPADLPITSKAWAFDILHPDRYSRLESEPMDIDLSRLIMIFPKKKGKSLQWALQTAHFRTIGGENYQYEGDSVVQWVHDGVLVDHPADFPFRFWGQVAELAQRSIDDKNAVLVNQIEFFRLSNFEQGREFHRKNP